MGSSGVYEKKGECNEELYWDMNPVGYSIANNAVPYITLTHVKNKALESPS